MYAIGNKLTGELWKTKSGRTSWKKEGHAKSAWANTLAEENWKNGTSLEAYHDQIDKWHESNSSLELHEYLQLSLEDYSRLLPYPTRVIHLKIAINGNTLENFIMTLSN